MFLLDLYNCLEVFLILAAMLFGFGIYGLIAHRTIIGMLIGAELILAGAAMNLMAFNRFLAPEPVIGQIFTLVIMGIAAAEAAIAISIIISVYRNYKSIDGDDIVDLRG